MDEHDLRKVAVLGQTVRKALFGAHGKAVGEDILVGQVPYRVIGVLSPKPAPFPEDDVNSQVVVPLGSAIVRLMDRAELTRINVEIADMRHARETEAAVTRVQPSPSRKAFRDRPMLKMPQRCAPRSSRFWRLARTIWTKSGGSKIAVPQPASRLGKPVAEIFADDGEARFRALEESATLELPPSRASGPSIEPAARLRYRSPYS